MVTKNIQRATCYLETGERSCFSPSDHQVARPVASETTTEFQIDSTSDFQWKGSDYRLSCGGGFCTLQKQVKHEESVGDVFLQVLAGILTLGLASCSSGQGSSSDVQSYDDVAKFVDADQAESAPAPDLFSTPLPFCSNTNFMAGCLSASEVGQMSSCLYLKWLSTSDGVPIKVPNYSALISYLDKNQEPWVYSELSTNNQLPTNITKGKVALYTDKPNSTSSYPKLHSSAELKMLWISFSLHDCYIEYVTPCTTDICNTN